MKELLKIIVLIGLTQSCTTLTYTKMQYITNFAYSTKNIPEYSKKLNDGLSDVRKKRAIYFANTLSTPELHLKELDSIFVQQKIDERKTILFQNSFEMLSIYSKMLSKLSSNKYEEDLFTNIKELEGDLKSLIILNNLPSNGSTGFINIFAKIGYLSGKYYIGYNQNYEIKRLVTTSDTLITNISDNIITYLTSLELNSIIEYENKMLSRNYLSYIQQNTKTNISEDVDYLQLKNNLNNINILKKQLIKAMSNLKVSHNVMVLELNKKNATIDNINQVKELLNTMIEINQIAKQIK